MSHDIPAFQVLKGKASKNEGIYRNIFTKDFDVLKDILGAREPHLTDEENPHTTTLEEVGLDNIQNYPVASEVEGRDATSTDRYLDLQGACAFVRTKLSPISGVGVPTNVSPDENTVLATTQPELSASGYSEFWDEIRQTREFQIAVLGTAFSDVVWEGSANTDSIVVDPPLPPEVEYEWRCRDIPEHGLPGQWSAAGRFSIPGASLRTPTLSGPTTDVTLTDAEFTTDVFFSMTGDTHQSSSWRLWLVDGETQTEVWSSLEDTNNLTSVIPDVILLPNKQYRLTVRHVGATLGQSSQATHDFTTVNAYVNTPVVSVNEDNGNVTRNPTFTLSEFNTTGYVDALKEVRIYATVDSTETLVATLDSTAPHTLTMGLTVDGVYEFSVVYSGDHLGDSEAVSVGPYTVLGAESVLFAFPPVNPSDIKFLTSTLILDNGTRVYGGYGTSSNGNGSKLVAVDSSNQTVFNKDIWVPGGGDTSVRAMATDGVNVYTVHLSSTRGIVRSHGADGVVGWCKQFFKAGGSRTIAMGIAYANGDLYLSGYHNAATTWSGFIIRLDTDGNLISAIEHQRSQTYESQPVSVTDAGDGLVVVTKERNKIVWTKYSYDLSSIIYSKTTSTYNNIGYNPSSNTKIYGNVLHIATGVSLYHYLINVATGDVTSVRHIGQTGDILYDALPLKNGAVLYTLRNTNLNTPQPKLALYDQSGAPVWCVRSRSSPGMGLPSLTGSSSEYDGGGVSLALLSGGAALGAYINPSIAPSVAVGNTTLGFDTEAAPAIVEHTDEVTIDLSSAPIGGALTLSWSDLSYTVTDNGDATMYDI